MLPRKIINFASVLILIFNSSCAEKRLEKSFIKAAIENNQLNVTIDSEIFTSYKFDSNLKKPYFYPVIGPKSGLSVTTESSEPYPHHNSLFFGCDRVNGGNFWQEGNDKGQIVSQGPKIIKKSGGKIIFSDECLWAIPGQEAVIRDERIVEITAPSDNLRFIDFVITVSPLVDIKILRTNHSLFSARVVRELSVESGGTLINAEGGQKEKGTFGIESGWCDYYGQREVITEGIAILQHPSNRWYPSRWFTRDYGFFSPTPMNWPENGEYTELPKGKAVRLRYRVVIHSGNSEAAGIGKIFKKYSNKTFQ